MTYDKYSDKAENFINDEEIKESLEYAEKNKDNIALQSSILKKAANKKGLEHREAAVLLLSKDETVNKEIKELAGKIKDEFYGNRIVLFAPLYLSNYCINSCVYCPYHVKNKNIKRKKLSREEIIKEVTALQDTGHKRLALELGEDPVNNPLSYLLESIDTIYSIKHKNGSIRRVNVNIAACSVEDYKKLHDAKIGTYILFQETYNKENYERLHPAGPKSDYNYHTQAMDRAQEGGIDDVGIGVLFGLNNYSYDFVGLLMHAEHLEARFNTGPHTVSVPRIRPADDIDVSGFKNSVPDDIFEKIVALIRISLPYTGMIISTRESRESREKVLKLGISQISGGSKTSVGGYDIKSEAENSEQFDVSDNRTLDEVVSWLIDMDYIPSFCTACYREGRTGDKFMSLVKSLKIGNVCQSNAILTLKEYLIDYAGEEVRKKGNKLIEKELLKIENESVRLNIKKYLENMESGKRDFRF